MDRTPRRPGIAAALGVMLTILALGCRVERSGGPRSPAPRPSSGANGTPILQRKTTYWDNGKPRTARSYYIDKSGEHILHGTSLGWTKGGTRRLQTEYVHGKLDGTLTEWYPDGTRARQGRWKQGREEGKWIAWHASGQKMSEVTYKKGKKTGREIYWADNVKVFEQVYNEEGVIQKQMTWYLRSGLKQSEGTFRNGCKHGTWTFWHTDGKIKAQGEWKDGKPWQGVCGVPAAGDAGSVGGILVFSRYRSGVRTGPATTPTTRKSK